MKVLVIVILLAVNGLAYDKCGHDLEIQCIDQINIAFPVCEKVAQKGGVADIDCMKLVPVME